MQLQTQYALFKDEKMHKYLKENSLWYKYLNRDMRNYDNFVKAIKQKYHLNLTDKINDTIDNIDLLSTVIQTLK